MVHRYAEHQSSGERPLVEIHQHQGHGWWSRALVDAHPGAAGWDDRSH